MMCTSFACLSVLILTLSSAFNSPIHRAGLILVLLAVGVNLVISTSQIGN